MFIVTSIRVGTCLACDREVECYEIEAQAFGLSGLLCAADFRKQVKVAAATAQRPVSRPTSLANKNSQPQG